MLSLDLEGAYDSVNLLKLCKILHSLKVPTIIIHFIYNSIKQRELERVYNRVTFAHGRTNKGLPQGSIFSPLLFNIYRHAVRRKDNLEVTGEEKPKTRLRRRKANKRLCREKKPVRALPDEEKPVSLLSDEKKPVCAVLGRKITTNDISREKKIEIY